MKMKSIFMMLVTATSVATFNSCDNDEAPAKSEESIYRGRLSKTWAVEQVTLDEFNVTTPFETMTLKINNDGSFVTTNPLPPVWPGSGSFALEKLSGGEHFKLTRNDGVVITVTQLTDSDFNFTFQFEAPANRGKAISGVYTFLTKAVN